MGFGMWMFKLGISIAFDAIDFIVPPGLGTIYDFFGGILGMFLWGKKGAFQFAEVLDITDRIDAFIPTLTIIGFLSMEEISE